MTDSRIPPPSPSSGEPGLFSSPETASPGAARLPWVIAGVVILLVLGTVLISTGRHPRAVQGIQPPAPYAASLVVSDPQMSESTALSGMKVTYIDGHIHNLGSQTVTGAIAQVQFSNDEQLPPQLETLPVTLIRTHEPAVDLQPISAAPIAPGEQREFRLIFENIQTNWNQQLPVIRLTQVETR